MAKLFTVHDAGVKIATLPGAKERFDEVNKEVFGADVSLNTQTPQNQIAGINALIWADIGEEVRRATIYSASLNHAPGKFLDAFGSLFSIGRRVATHTRVECELTGIDGTVVPAGSIVKNTHQDQFRSESSVEIVDGKATVSFVAIESGSVPAEAGSVNTIVSVTDPRWQTVNNPTAGIVGVDEESDAEYRANLKRLTGLASSGTISAIRSAMLNVGASKIVVLENSTDSVATRQGIAMPARSLLVVADTGLVSDLTRAYESYRPIGTSTHALVAASKAWVASDTSNVNSGSFRYNRRSFTGVDLRSASTMSNLLSTLNGISNGPEFTSSGNIPMLSYTWSPDLDGLEEVKGNANDAVVSKGVQIERVIAVAGTDDVYFKFNTPVGSVSATCTVTREGGGAPSSLTLHTQNNMGSIVALRTSADLPQDLASITFQSITAQGQYLPDDGGGALQHTFTNVQGEVVPYAGSGSTVPSHTLASGQGRDGVVVVSAAAAGTVNVWQYLRYDGIDYIDKDANGNPEWQNATPGNTLTYYTVSGFTNGRQGSRLHIRPYSNADGPGPEQIVLFEPSDDQPVLSGASVDGQQITLEFDTMLVPKSTTTRSGWSVTVGGNARAISRIFSYRNTMYLMLNSAVTPGQAVTVSYDLSATTNATRLTGRNRVDSADFSIASANMQNVTQSGVPAAPASFRSFRTGDNVVKATWRPNSNGGQTIDAYEYGISYDNGVSWSEWTTLPASAREVTIEPNTTSQLPNRIRARASNPNAHILQKLGFTGLNALAPITRPVEHPLAIAVTLDDASDLVRDALNDIKTALIDRVNAYEMGETIWVNDLLAVAELVQGARITDISVTHNSVDVNDVAQPAYVLWSLTENNITFL